MVSFTSSFRLNITGITYYLIEFISSFYLTLMTYSTKLTNIFLEPTNHEPNSEQMIDFARRKYGQQGVF